MKRALSLRRVRACTSVTALLYRNRTDAFTKSFVLQKGFVLCFFPIFSVLTDLFSHTLHTVLLLGLVVPFFSPCATKTARPGVSIERFGTLGTVGSQWCLLV